MSVEFTAPLVGRKVDVGIFQTGDDSTQLFPGNGGVGVAGLAKLAQRVVIAMYTAQGTKKYAVDTGTKFVPLINSGQIRTAADIRPIFSYIRSELLRQFDSADVDRPDDESLADIELISASISDSTLALSVRITSIAGQRGDITSPITVS